MARTLFCPGKLKTWVVDDDGLPPNQSTGKDAKPGVLIRESLDGSVKHSTGQRGVRSGSRSK